MKLHSNSFASLQATQRSPLRHCALSRFTSTF